MRNLEIPIKIEILHKLDPELRDGASDEEQLKLLETRLTRLINKLNAKLQKINTEEQDTEAGTE